MTMASAQKQIDEHSLLVPSLVLKQADAKRIAGGDNVSNSGRRAPTLPSGTTSQSTPSSEQPPPSGAEVAEVARKLGIDLVFDSDLLYIAEDLLLSALPEGWERHKDDKGKPYYHNKKTHSTQWAHPLETYYRGLVFMRKEGDQLLEDKAVHNPPTPEETREMANYFGIDPHEEVILMPIAKAAVNAPLPPEWDEFEDDDGEVYFVSKITKKTSEHHPLDGYFFELINQKRFELADLQPPVYPMSDFHLLDASFVPYPWMEFVEIKTGRPFWYNFRDNLTTYHHPCDLIKDLIKTEAVLRLQAFHRGQLVRDLNRKLVENLASTSIQKMYRGFTCRLMMDKRRHQMMNKASVRIQSNWRGRKQRRRNEEERRADAACLIQAAWRGMKARQLVANMEYTLLAVPLELTVARASAYQDEEDLEAAVVVDMSAYVAMDAMASQLEAKPEPPLENMDRKVSGKDQLPDEAPSRTKKPSGPGSVTSNVTKKSSGRKKKLSGRNSSGRR